MSHTVSGKYCMCSEKFVIILCVYFRWIFGLVIISVNLTRYVSLEKMTVFMLSVILNRIFSTDLVSNLYVRWHAYVETWILQPLPLPHTIRAHTQNVVL
jgi:hypothetical protein